MSELLTAIGPMVPVIGLILTIWWRFEGKISDADKRAAVVERELAEHKLHAAETYITKQGLRETAEQLMAAISGVKAAVENMTLRVDRVVENQGKATRSTTRG